MDRTKIIFPILKEEFRIIDESENLIRIRLFDFPRVSCTCVYDKVTHFECE